MFAKTIVMSDAFLDMPLGARCLYFTLGMVADDDGFVNSPKSVIRQCAATEDDLKILIAKKFVIVFENGVLVIKHWKINNYIQKDRYIATKYADLKAYLSLDENNAYRKEKEPCIQNVYTGKDSIGKDSIDNSITQIENVWQYGRQCECYTKSKTRCERKASYLINGKYYCNQHSRKVLVPAIKKLPDFSIKEPKGNDMEKLRKEVFDG